MMKRYILAFLIAGLFIHALPAQSRSDSLQQALRNAAPDTVRVRLLQELSWELKDKDPTAAQQAAAKGIRLAESLDFRQALPDLYKNSGVIHYYTSELDLAKTQLMIAKELYQLLDNQKGVANVLSNLGMVAQANGQHDLAIDHFLQSAHIRDRIGDKAGRANSLTNIGVMYYMSGKYEYSLTNHLLALKIWKELDHYVGSAFSYMNIGRVHVALGEYDDAEENFHRAYEIHLVLENLRGQADARANLGELFLKRDDYPAAHDHFLKALSLREELRDKTGIREALTYIGQARFGMNEIGEAISNFQRALHIATQINDKQGIILIHNLLGQAYTAHNQPATAIKHLKAAAELAQELGTRHEQSKAYQLLAEAFKRLGEYQKAYEYLNLHLEQEGEVLNASVIKNSKSIQADYEKELQAKEAEIRAKHETIRSLQRYNLSFVFAVLVLVVVAGYLLHRYRYKSRMALKLNEQKQEIENQNLALAMSNADLEQFAYAVSHDLKQPLRTIGSFTSLIARRYKPHLDEDGNQYLKFVTDGVSHMHHLLSDILIYSQVGGQEQPETLDLNLAMNEALQNMEHFIRSEQALIEVDVLPIIMGHYSGMVRLFQNIIHNAVKFHGDELPAVEVTYSRLSNDHLIAVRDNGVGIDRPYLNKIFALFQRLHTQDEYPGTGIGLAICQKVVRQHGGKIWVESTPGEGSTFFIRLPKDHFQVE